MQPDFQLLSVTRQNIAKLCSAFSLDQLNKIPEGFNNNLAWNAGHVVATQHLLTYGLSGMPLPLASDFVEAYRKGSRPQGAISPAEWAFIHDQLSASVEQLKTDWGQLSGATFKAYPTSYGISLNSLNEAFIFNQTHEAMHFGTMLAIRKLI